MTLIKLPGGGGHRQRQGYRGEQLAPAADDFFAAVGNEQIDAFLLEHPEFLQQDQVTAGADATPGSRTRVVHAGAA